MIFETENDLEVIKEMLYILKDKKSVSRSGELETIRRIIQKMKEAEKNVLLLQQQAG